MCLTFPGIKLRRPRTRASTSSAMSTRDVGTIAAQLDRLSIAESSAKRSPTSFAEIPTEIVENISEYLEAADFFSFRRSGRTAWIGSSDTFVKKFFTKKRILWTEHAFCAFKDMAKDERLLRKIEHVVFVMPPRLKLLTNSEMQQAITIQKTSGQSLNVADYMKFAGEHSDFLYEYSAELLSVIFQALKTMAVIFVSLGSQALSAISKFLEVPERRIWDVFLLSRGISAIGRFFCTAQTQVAEFRSPVQAPQHVKFYLETLRLDLTSNLHTWNKVQLERGFTRFLSACPRIKTFDLSTRVDNCVENGMFFLDRTLPLLRFPHLEFLCIDKGVCSARALCKVLKTHSHTLKSFAILSLHVADGTLQQVMDEVARLPMLRLFFFYKLKTHHGANLKWCAVKVPLSCLLAERLEEAWKTVQTAKVEGNEGNAEDICQTDGASLSLEKGDNGQMQVLIATHYRSTNRVDIPETHRASWECDTVRQEAEPKCVALRVEDARRDETVDSGCGAKSSFNKESGEEGAARV
ncbi:hypothetical protein BDV97DRAFT_372263 [Delphinella strobiligena]|nr:hypothetical protein BDV97DRAFT_372263 [Delphinella strobiligena]